MMDGTMSLSSRDKKVRDYWIEAAKGGREISYQMGKELGVKCMHNIWIPDGMKDMPASRAYYRALLTDSLDKIFEKKYDKKYMADSLEGKLFGIGTEVFVVGSHDFYLSYAIKNNIGITMDTGHYHPTEQVYDKISAVAPFVDDIQLHVSRGVRWDSDHVVTQSDELSLLFLEIARNGLFDKVHIGLDYFDASINRVIAWAVGLRATGKAILSAYLEPTDLLTKAEAAGDFSSRLALHEEIKNLPVNAVWDMACLKKGMPEGSAWIAAAKKYESDVLLKRK